MALEKEKVNEKKKTSNKTKTATTKKNKTTSTQKDSKQTIKNTVKKEEVKKNSTRKKQVKTINTKETKVEKKKKETDKVSKTITKKTDDKKSKVKPKKDKEVKQKTSKKVKTKRSFKEIFNIKPFLIRVKEFFLKVFSKIGSFFKGILFFFKKMFSKINYKKKKDTTKTSKSKNNHSSKREPFFTAKTKKLFIIVSIICLLIILAECVYLFIRYLDIESKTVHYDSLNSVAIDNNTVVAVGSSNFKYSKYNKYTRGLEKAKLIKYDNNGKVLFEIKYDKGINTTFSSVVSVSDGYVVVGSGVFSEKEQQEEAREAIIIKYDKDGNLVWEKFYQVITNTRFNKVIETTDGYIAIGQSIYANMELGNHTTGGGIIVKYDKDGNVVWKNNHGGTKSGNFNDIVEVNGSYYVVGKDASDYGNIIKYNSNGEYQWHKNYSYTDGFGFSGIAYLDNSLYVVGSKKILEDENDEERNTTNTDALLVKYNLDGQIELEKTFGGSNYERYNSIVSYKDTLITVGHTTSKDAGLKITTTDDTYTTGMLIRYDKNGNITKKEVYGGSNNDSLTDIKTDGVSTYITGYSNSEDGNITTSKNNGKDYFGKIIKLDFKYRTLFIK